VWSAITSSRKAHHELHRYERCIDEITAKGCMDGALPEHSLDYNRNDDPAVGKIHRVTSNRSSVLNDGGVRRSVDCEAHLWRSVAD
jgi:hypothetical protein